MKDPWRALRAFDSVVAVYQLLKLNVSLVTATAYASSITWGSGQRDPMIGTASLFPGIVSLDKLTPGHRIRVTMHVYDEPASGSLSRPPEKPTRDASQ